MCCLWSRQLEHVAWQLDAVIDHIQAFIQGWVFIPIIMVFPRHLYEARHLFGRGVLTRKYGIYIYFKRIHTHYTCTHIYIYTNFVIFCGAKELHILLLHKIYSMRNIFKTAKFDIYHTQRSLDFLNFGVLMNEIELYEPTYTQTKA